MISAFLKKLLFVRQFSIVDGKIEMLEKREIMLPSDLFFKIQESNDKVYEVSKKAALKSTKEFAVKIGRSEDGMMENLKNIFESFGIGPIEIPDLNNEKKEAIVIVKESLIATEYKTLEKNSKKNSCDLIAGILAGMFSHLFDSNIDAMETKCLSTGAPYCSFKIGRNIKKK